MLEIVTVPVSFFEIVFTYDRPDVRLIGDRVLMIQALMSAWAPFDASLDDIENLTTGKFSEQGLLFKIPSKHVTFFVGPTYCRFSRSAVSWALAEETRQILALTLSTLVQIADLTMRQQMTIVGLHVQPKVKLFIDILQRFVPPDLASLNAGSVRTAAAFARWEDRAVTLDGSANVPNAIFLKMERTFPPSTSFQDIFGRLFEDQKQMYSVMGITEEGI